MNKINPFILVGIIFAVFVAVLIKSSYVRSDLGLEAKAVLAFEERAKRVNALKKMWSKDALEKRLNALFGQVIDKGNVFEIRSAALTHQQANDFIRKALAEAFEIRQFDFTANGEDSYHIVMEIKK
jgi:hypothetical protein